MGCQSALMLCFECSEKSRSCFSVGDILSAGQLSNGLPVKCGSSCTTITLKVRRNYRNSASFRCPI